MSDRIEKIKKGFNNFRTTRVWSDFGESVDVDDVAFLLVEIEALTKENAGLKEKIDFYKLEFEKYKDRNEGLLKENKGLSEYAESRDESIAVYREEIAELRERLKVKFAPSDDPEDWDESDLAIKEACEKE